MYSLKTIVPSFSSSSNIEVIQNQAHVKTHIDCLYVRVHSDVKCFFPASYYFLNIHDKIMMKQRKIKVENDVKQKIFSPSIP